jgi:hypothetical protein
MKNISNKEMSYSLNNSDNFKKELDDDITYIVNKLSDLLLEYLKFIIENIKAKHKNFYKFIILRGLDTIINVFNYLLLYTKNIELTYFHCQKSFYLYVEFIGQISEDEKMFLQLTSRDASIYVYKKTIFEINSELKKNNENISDYTKIKLDIINVFIDLYKTLLIKLVNDDYSNDKNLTFLEEIFKKINNISDKPLILKLNNITEKLFYDIENANYLFETINALIKKSNKNTEIFGIVQEKLMDENFKKKVSEPYDKFILWLTN